MLETERLTLRPWTEADLDCYRTLCQDAGYTSFASPGVYAFKDEADLLAKVSFRAERFRRTGLSKFLVFEKASGTLVGTCGVDPFDFHGEERFELGYRLLRAHWKKGYASEAARAWLPYYFKVLKGNRLHAFAAHDNLPSLKVIERLQFAPSGEFVYSGVPHKLYEKTSD